MQMILESDNILKTVKDLNIELNLDKDLDIMKNELGKVVSNTIDKVCGYTIKAMPIPDSFKDILFDIKESFKTKDFKEIIKTVVSSSVREGLEILGVSKESIRNIKEVMSIAVKGGLMEGVKAGIDMMSKKYLNNNIVGNFVYEFFNHISNSPLNKEFGQKMNITIDKVLNSKDKFYDMCNQFKEAYEKFDIDKINDIAKNINSKLKIINYDRECISENKIIQNIAMLVNSKKEKLTDAQLQLCNVL